MMASAHTLPGRFGGVLKIVSFNARFYIGSSLGLLVAAVLLASHRLPQMLAWPVLFVAALGAFWTLSSLLVSWYVYDYAGVTRWEWMRIELAVAAPRWVNIHAGLDESTASLRRLLAGGESMVVDIYDATEMTEPSIARARRMHPATEPFIAGSFHTLPLPDNDLDLVFLLFAAHELRVSESRTQLLLEAARVLRSGGNVILVEHLRDWANLIAFGPGFLHFHSEQSWRCNIREAGLRIEKTFCVTPFVRCFVLRN